MKLKTLIAKLEKARASYVKKHGVEPTVWAWRDTLELCGGVTKGRGEMQGCTSGKRPYEEYQLENVWG